MSCNRSEVVKRNPLLGAGGLARENHGPILAVEGVVGPPQYGRNPEIKLSMMVCSGGIPEVKRYYSYNENLTVAPNDGFGGRSS
jgi:hypothetical protein